MNLRIPRLLNRILDATGRHAAVIVVSGLVFLAAALLPWASVVSACLLGAAAGVAAATLVWHKLYRRLQHHLNWCETERGRLQRRLSEQGRAAAAQDDVLTHRLPTLRDRDPGTGPAA